MNIWLELGIDETLDKRKIKRAYAAKLKINNPEDDPESFQILRDAYENALYYSEHASQENDFNTERETEQKIQDNYKNKSLNIFDHITADTEVQKKVQPTEKDDVSEIIQSSDFDTNLEENQANVYLTDIEEALTLSDESIAIDKLKFAMDQVELDNFETRLWFEINLVVILCKQNNIPFNLAFYASEIFRWEQDWRHLYDSVPNEAQYLMGRIQTKRKYFELQTNNNSSPEYKARNSLFGKYRPKLFFLRSLTKKNRDAIRYLIYELQKAYPALFEYELDERIVSWWQRKTQKIHFGWFHIIFSILVVGLIPGFLSNITKPMMDVIGRGNVYLILLISVLISSYIITNVIPIIKKNHYKIKDALKSKLSIKIAFIISNIFIALSSLLFENYNTLQILIIIGLHLIFRGPFKTIKISLFALLATVFLNLYSDGNYLLSDFSNLELYLFSIVGLVIFEFGITIIRLKIISNFIYISNEIDRVIYNLIISLYNSMYKLVSILILFSWLIYSVFTLLVVFEDNAEDIQKIADVFPMIGFWVSESYKTINGEQTTKIKKKNFEFKMNKIHGIEISDRTVLKRIDGYWKGSNGVAKNVAYAYSLLIKLEEKITGKILTKEPYKVKRNRLVRLTGNFDMGMLIENKYKKSIHKKTKENPVK